MKKVKSLWQVEELRQERNHTSYIVTDVADVTMHNLSFQISDTRTHTSEKRGEHFFDGSLSIYDKDFRAQISFKHLLLRREGFIQLADMDDCVHTFKSVEIYLQLKLLST
jgi:hypothetical protein